MTMMKALQVTEFGTSPALSEIPIPEPGRGDVLIKIEACGLNFADLLMAKGTYQETPPLPFTLGIEVCGTIAAVGPETTGVAVGQRVVAFGGQGGLAQFSVFPASVCRPVPDEMPSDVAAGFMVAYGTSHLALTRRGRLQPGETLLVLGASGGVGLTAVEVGKLLGAKVIAVARGAEKCAVAAKAGADHTIDASADIKAEVKALGGADVVYDAVGGDQFKAAFGATKPEGRILSIGFASGDIPRPPANHLLVKNIDVIGFYWGGYMRFAPQAVADSLSELMDLYGQDRLSPHISHTLPLERADEALALLRDRKSTGKVVVTCN